jgi:hypothetical protein
MNNPGAEFTPETGARQGEHSFAGRTFILKCEQQSIMGEKQDER